MPRGFRCGLPALDPTYHLKTNQRWYSLPLGKHGFLIDCAGVVGGRFLGTAVLLERVPTRASGHRIQARTQAPVRDLPGRYPALA